jgi:flagellar biosynthetic protein FliR
MKLTLTLADVFSYLVVFTRLAGFASLAPAFGEHTINPRIRLLIVLGITLMVAPTLKEVIPLPGKDPWMVQAVLLQEFLLGVFAALMLRILMSALDLTGTLVANNMGLMNAFTHSLSSSQQAGLVSAFLTWVGTMLIFATDFHHTLLRMMMESFYIFPPGDFSKVHLLMGDMGYAMLRFVSASFVLALQLATPMLLLNLLMMVAIGMINRLMPGIQVFFITQPLQLILGYLILVAGTSAMMGHFIQEFAHMGASIWTLK